MSRPLRVLVTAIGGDLGQTLVKALRLSSGPVECFGCDQSETGVGALFVESFHSVPAALESDYVPTLERLCRSLGIDAVIPASEAEIDRLSRLQAPGHLSSGVPVVCQPAGWVKIYGDKLECMKALSGKVELAPFADGLNRKVVQSVVKETGFPLVVKERHSWGSRSLRVARNQRALDLFLEEAKEPLIQAFMDDSEGEYSVGVFSQGGGHRLITFRRKLGYGGTSLFAETVDEPEVKNYALKIAQVVAASGSFNIQVRKTRKGVRLLEINPRFSSLAAARTLCGFRDVEWSLDLVLGRAVQAPPPSYRKIRFSRFLGELVDAGQGYEALPEWGPRSSAGKQKE